MAKNKTNPQPWERQPGETAENFKAFVVYRDANPKISAEKVAEVLTAEALKKGHKLYKNCMKNPGLMRQWCAKFKWVERREAWEDEKDRLVREELVRGVTAMRKNHTDIATQMLVKALRGLQALPAERMTAYAIAQMVDIASKLERLSRGEATERTEGKNEVFGKMTVATDPYEELTTEELRALAKLADDEGQN